MFLSDETTTLSSLLQMIHFNYISLRALSNHIPKEIRTLQIISFPKSLGYWNGFGILACKLHFFSIRTVLLPETTVGTISGTVSAVALHSLLRTKLQESYTLSDFAHKFDKINMIREGHGDKTMDAM